VGIPGGLERPSCQNGVPSAEAHTGISPKSNSLVGKGSHSMGDTAYKHLHKEKGMCLNCSQPALLNFDYCWRHLYTHHKSDKEWHRRNAEHQKIVQLERRKRYKLENRCVSCGMPLNEESRLGFQCINCAQRITGISLRHRRFIQPRYVCETKVVTP
jgi:hypothetical protein